MLNVNEIYTALNWLKVNERGKLNQWLADNFGWDSRMVDHLRKDRIANLAREISEYDDSVQMALVELMY